MKTKEEKTMHSLMGKLDRLQMEKSVQLSPDEALLYHTGTMDELPLEDHVEPLKKNQNGS